MAVLIVQTTFTSSFGGYNCTLWEFPSSQSDGHFEVCISVGCRLSDSLKWGTDSRFGRSEVSLLHVLKCYWGQLARNGHRTVAGGMLRWVEQVAVDESCMRRNISSDQYRSGRLSTMTRTPVSSMCSCIMQTLASTGSPCPAHAERGWRQRASHKSMVRIAVCVDWQLWFKQIGRCSCNVKAVLKCSCVEETRWGAAPIALHFVLTEAAGSAAHLCRRGASSGEWLRHMRICPTSCNANRMPTLDVETTHQRCESSC